QVKMTQIEVQQGVIGVFRAVGSRQFPEGLQTTFRQEQKSEPTEPLSRIGEEVVRLSSPALVRQPVQGGVESFLLVRAGRRDQIRVRGGRLISLAEQQKGDDGPCEAEKQNRRQ